MMNRIPERYYLAYGSNLNIDQMRIRCPQARIVGTAMVKDYRLMFKGSKSGAYLTIEPSEGSGVPVAVWRVTPTDEQNLDCYEGFPTFYYKKEMIVSVRLSAFCNPATQKIKAFAYIMHEDRAFGIPTQTYINVCAEGYSTFGFDKRILNEAIAYSKKGIREEIMKKTEKA